MNHTPLRHPLALAAMAAVATVSSLTAPLAQAQERPYLYLGASAGQARTHVDETRAISTALGGGIATTDVRHEEHHSAYKVFGGMQFNRYLDMEVGYFNLGKFGFSATVPAGSVSSEFRVQGANIDLVGTLPITDNLSGLARLGAQYARTRTSLFATGQTTLTSHPSDRETNVKYGVGLQYAFSPAVQLRGEVERLRVSDALDSHPRVTMVSVGLVFPFGRNAEPMRRSSMAMPMDRMPPTAAGPMAPAAAPVVVAQAPMAAPMAPAPMQAAAPSVRRVSYAAESFFGFDQAELRAEGKTALDTFASELSGTTFDNISVKGHADRLGSSAYNQTLSLERADSVKRYLVTSGKLDPAKITTQGMSETHPVTLPDTCKGEVSASVIACLQPDRRVMIEVTGTR